MPLPVIIDCDPGTDDAIALFLAFASPELDLRAVTVAGGNVGLEHTLPNALALARLAGSPSPVHAGADRPLLGTFTSAPDVHGDDGIGGIVLPPGGAPAQALAADAIRTILRNSADPVTLVGIGPVTNLALALATEPALACKVGQIVLMSGARADGNVTPAAEFNAWSDPEALAIILAAGRPVVFATLELTAQALVTPARIAAWRALGQGACLQAACDIQSRVPPSRRLGGRGAPLHDPCAIAWLLRPDLFTARPASVRVDLGPGPDRGRTIISHSGINRPGINHSGIDHSDATADPPNAMVLEAIDADGFFTFLGSRLALLP